MKRASFPITPLIVPALLFLLALAASGDPGPLLPAALISCGAAAVLMLLYAPMRRNELPIVLAVSVYVLWGMISTFYAVSRKLALMECAKWLIAYAVFLAGLFLLSRHPNGFRVLSGAISWTALTVGILSLDAASSSFLIRGFRAVMGLVTTSYAQAGAGFPSRLATIFDNANTYAGIMSVAVLLSLWLLLTAKTPRQRILGCILSAGNSFCYLLAFSMGSLVFFALACLLMLACAGKQRLALFLIMLEHALAALLGAGLAMPGLPRHPSGSFLPLAVWLAITALACVLDLFLRDPITARLQGRGKAILLSILGLLLLAGAFLFVALHWSAPYEVKPSDTLKRGIDLTPGAYVLRVEADTPARIDISYRNKDALITNRDLPLTQGSSETPCYFTVPEDSEIVFVRVLGQTRVTSVTYEGPQSGSLMLRYRLLPAFIANRIQALGAPGTFIQRLGFWQDGMKLFLRSPLIGSGLGCVESQLAGVRNYHYEIRQLHNHFVQMLADGGLLGLMLYLGIIGTALLTLLSALRSGSQTAPVLLPCCIQMFGQSITDVTWSAGHCLPIFFLILAMTARSDPAPAVCPPKTCRGFSRTAAILLLLYCIPLTGSVSAQVLLARAPSLEQLQLCTKLDYFDANGHKLSYVLSSIGNSDPKVRQQAEHYAAQLKTVPSNTIPMYLARYRLAEGDYPAAKEMFDWAIQCSAGDQTLWNDIFRCYHTLLSNPELSAVADADFTAWETRLLEWNQQAMAPHRLDPDNALIAAALSARAPGESFPDAEARVLLDTSHSPDLDRDNCPDICQSYTGPLFWDSQGAAHMSGEASLSFLIHPTRPGRYRLQVECTAPAALTGLSCADQNFSFTLADGSAYWEIQLDPDSSDSLYDLTLYSESTSENIIHRVSFQALPQ